MGKKKSKEPCDIGVFRDYSVWDKTICDKVRAFKKEKGYYPTGMLARRSTYYKIDEAAKEHHDECDPLECQDPWGNTWEESWDDFEGYISALGVRGEFCITFYVDTEKKLPEDVFKLIFDEDPTFDGEEDPADLLPLAVSA